MGISLIGGILLTMFFDVRVLIKQDKVLVEENIRLSSRVGIPFAMMMVSFLVVPHIKSELIIPICVLFFLSFYLICRQAILLKIKSIDRKFWMAIDALGVLLFWFLGIIAANFILSGIRSIFPMIISELGEILIVAMLSFGLALKLIYQVSARMSSKGFFFNVGLYKAGQSSAKLIGIPVLIGICFSFLSSLIILYRPVQPDTPLSEILSQVDSSSGLLVVFIALAILLAPFAEEVIFRGYFFRVLKELKGERIAIILISCIFALLHVGQYWGDWVAILMVTVLGFSLTLLRSFTGSTITSMVMHYVYNFGVAIIPGIIAIVDPSLIPPHLK